MFQPDLLSGQRILVTGGGSGLGRAMAEAFLSLGADVAICGRRKPVCDQTAAEWRARFPARRIETFGVDIRSSADVDQMIDALWRTGGLTGLVNNAAGNFIARTESLSARAFDAVANIVFHGSFYVTQAVGKRWIGEAQTGAWQSGQPCRSVLSIVTTWVDNGSPYVVPSAMSKAGVAIMTKSLAVEWAKFGIRLNAVGPGLIMTEGMATRLYPAGRGAARGTDNPMARNGTETELRNLASFLMASGRCDWLNGQVFMMDGGNALATGGNFYPLHSWGDEDWQAARRESAAQDAKDKSQR